MSKWLTIIFAAQLILGAIWTLPQLFLDNSSLAILMLFFYTYPFHLVFFFIAAWAMWKHPQSRNKAIRIMLLPIGFLFLPFGIKFIVGGPLSDNSAVVVAVLAAAACLGAGIVFPERTVRVLPDRMFQSRGFNLLIVGSMVLAWLFPVAVTILLLQQGSLSPTGGGQGSPGMELAYVLIAGALYVIAVGGASLFTLVFGWLGLRGGVADAQRNLHVTQIVVGAPGVILGALTLAWLASQN